MTASANLLSPSAAHDALDALTTTLEQRAGLVHRRQPIRRMAVAIATGRHVLLEARPGTGKTILVRRFAECIDVSFGRIQGRADLMPVDIVGYHTVDAATGNLVWRPGPIMNGIVLYDEISRATAKAQAAALQPMQEKVVTVDTHTYPCPEIFMVAGTQNPIEEEGTNPLPAAELDRFMFIVPMPELEPAEEARMILDRRLAATAPEQRLAPVMNTDQILALRQAVLRVHIEPEIAEYMVELANATRAHRAVLNGQGMSPRASQQLAEAACAVALFAGRNYVTPEDVAEVFEDVAAHRISLGDSFSGQIGFEREAQREVAREVLNGVPTRNLPGVTGRTAYAVGTR